MFDYCCRLIIDRLLYLLFRMKVVIIYYHTTNSSSPSIGYTTAIIGYTTDIPFRFILLTPKPNAYTVYYKKRLTPFYELLAHALYVYTCTPSLP